MLTSPSYTKALQAGASPQLMQVFCQGRPYPCTMLHASRVFLGVGDRSGGAPHAHMLYHIVLYVKGENYAWYMGTPCRFRPGTLIVSSPGEPHNFFKRKPGEAAYLEVTFEYRAGEEPLPLPFHKVLSLLTGSNIPAAGYPVDLDEGVWPQLAARMTALVETMALGMPHSAFSGHVMLGEIFDLLTQSVYLEGRKEASDLPARLEKVRHAMECNYGQAASIYELASMAQVSVGHFCREFKRAFGTTPMGYLQQCRIAAAKTLLSATRIPCREIAARTGFSDEYYFSRVFRKTVGVSPSYYRKAQEAGQNTTAKDSPAGRFI